MTSEEFFNGLGPREKPLVGVYGEVVENLLGRSPFEVLEVGSGWGIFSRSVLDRSSIARVTTIDKIPVGGRQEFNERTAGFEDRIERLVGQSKDILPQLRLDDRKFDLIMVDGAHDYDNCLNDLRLCWPMLKADGVLMIDDVFHKHNWDDDYGVTRALWDFAELALPVGMKFEFYRVGSGGLAVIKNVL